MRIHIRMITIALCLLLATACANRQPIRADRPDDLRAAQRTFQIAVASADAAQEVLQAFVKDGLLSPELAAVMVDVANHVEQVAKNAGSATGKLEALSAEDRQNIAKSVAIILEAVDASENQLHLIPNPKVRRVIQASLLGLKIAIAAAQPLAT